jgi:hypothetical protein
MVKLIEMVSIAFLGLFAMGQVDKLASDLTDIGAYGTSTGSIGELFFFLIIFLVIVLVSKAYFTD